MCAPCCCGVQMDLLPVAAVTSPVGDQGFIIGRVPQQQMFRACRASVSRFLCLALEVSRFAILKMHMCHVLHSTVNMDIYEVTVQLSD